MKLDFLLPSPETLGKGKKAEESFNLAKKARALKKTTGPENQDAADLLERNTRYFAADLGAKISLVEELQLFVYSLKELIKEITSSVEA